MKSDSPQEMSPAHTRGLLLRWLLGLVVIFGAAAIFLDLAEDVWLKEGFAWDAPLMLGIHRLSAPWLNTLMLGITATASSLIVIPAAAVVLWLWVRQRARLMALTLAVSLTGSTIINTLLKALFARPRPELFPPLVQESSYSFPSGHTSAAMAFYGLLAILLWQNRHRVWAVLAGIWVLAVAVSRVYLGAHYPSDVLGSLVLGVIWITTVMLVYHYYGHRQRRAKPDPNRDQ